jgi:hypothetical protein
MNWSEINTKTGTHRNLFLRALRMTSGMILELGTGFESTPYLGDFLKSEGAERNAWSFESDENWLVNFLSLRSVQHRIDLASNRYTNVPIEHFQWGVALVDHSRDGTGTIRPDAIRRLIGRCDIIVAHDTEDEHEQDYGYSSVFGLFKYRFDETFMGVRTTLLSNTIPLTA